jgi:hypothetical protein
MNTFQKIISISLLIVSLSVAYYFIIYIPNKDKQKSEQIKTEVEQKKIEELNSETILLNYKVDSNKNISLVETLLTALNNDPTSVCSSIMTNTTSHNHIYYLYSDYVNGLERDYGQYRGSIAFIASDLDGKYKTINMAKEQCNSSGYKIP